MSMFRAGAAYFAIVFTVGFAAGTLRTLLLVPRTGESLAVLLELPLMLTASWFISLRICRELAVPPLPGPRLAMGLVALTLLLVAEWLLAMSLAGRTAAEHFGHYLTWAGALGLVGQCAFAAMPSLQAKIQRRQQSCR